MIYLIIGVVIGIILVIADSIDYGFEFWTLLRVLIGFLIGLVVWISVGTIIGLFLPTEYQLYETQNLSALKDNSSISGSFFLGSGTVDEHTVYKYVTDTDKGKLICELSAENSDIYINECDEQSRVEIYSEGFVSDWYAWFAFTGWSNNEVIFYIPEGSLTTEFDIDLE